MKQYSQGSISVGGSGQNGIINRCLSAAAQAWGFTSPGAILLMWTIPIVVILGAMVAAVMGKEAYKWYTGEDQFAEVMQVIFYVIAFVVCSLVVKKLWQKDEKAIAGLYLIVLCGLVFLIGEELSWGQRIFGWETSQAFREVNKQEETNLHNVHGVGATFKWVQMLIGLYGTLLPLLFIRLEALRRNEDFFSFVIPHFTLIPFFMPLFVWRLYRNIFEEPPKNLYFVISEFNEVVELLLAIGMALFMIYQYRRLKAGRV